MDRKWAMGCESRKAHQNRDRHATTDCKTSGSLRRSCTFTCDVCAGGAGGGAPCAESAGGLQHMVELVEAMRRVLEVLEAVRQVVEVLEVMRGVLEVVESTRHVL